MMGISGSIHVCKKKISGKQGHDEITQLSTVRQHLTKCVWGGGGVRSGADVSTFLAVHSSASLNIKHLGPESPSSWLPGVATPGLPPGPLRRFSPLDFVLCVTDIFLLVIWVIWGFLSSVWVFFSCLLSFI